MCILTWYPKHVDGADGCCCIISSTSIYMLRPMWTYGHVCMARSIYGHGASIDPCPHDPYYAHLELNGNGPCAHLLLAYPGPPRLPSTNPNLLHTDRPMRAWSAVLRPFTHGFTLSIPCVIWHFFVRILGKINSISKFKLSIADAINFKYQSEIKEFRSNLSCYMDWEVGP